MTTEIETDRQDDSVTDKHKADKRSGMDWIIHEVRELVVTIVVFLPIWMVFTSFVFELRSIPSESMVPALQVGDRVAVSKFAYGYSANSPIFGLGRAFFGDDKDKPDQRIFKSNPKRGDVIVFRHPNDDKVMIKRLIGLPGDRIRMNAGVVYLNGEAIKREAVRQVRYVPAGKRMAVNAVEYRETLPSGVSYLTNEFPGEVAYDETPEFIVPADHVFMMGDNRDNSEDSRAPSGHPALARANPHAWGRPVSVSARPSAIGYVPMDHLMGRAETVLFSLYSCRKAPETECAAPRLWRGLKTQP